MKLNAPRHHRSHLLNHYPVKTSTFVVGPVPKQAPSVIKSETIVEIVETIAKLTPRDLEKIDEEN